MHSLSWALCCPAGPPAPRPPRALPPLPGRRSSRPRPLLCSLLHQLRGGKRRRDELYECDLKCEGIADFRLALPGGQHAAQAAAQHCPPATCC